MADDYQKIIEAWQTRHTATNKIGRVTHAALLKKLRGISDSECRRQARADALQSILDAVTQAGFRTSAGEITRLIKLYQVATLLGVPTASNRTLRTLSPLVTRIAKDESWHVRSGKHDDALALVARLETLEHAQVGAEVARILGREVKPKVSRPKATATQKAVSQLCKLTPDEMRVMLLSLRGSDAKTFSMLLNAIKPMVAKRPVVADVQPVAQKSVPIGPPPGKKSLLGRLAG